MWKESLPYGPSGPKPWWPESPHQNVYNLDLWKVRAGITFYSQSGAFLVIVPKMNCSDAFGPSTTIWRNPRDQISTILSSSGDNRQAVQWLEGGLRGWGKVKKREMRRSGGIRRVGWRDRSVGFGVWFWSIWWVELIPQAWKHIIQFCLCSP